MIQRFKKIISFINSHPLSSKHKLRAYINFITWQIEQAIYSKAKVVEFVKPTRLLVSKGMTGATGNIYTGLHEFYDMGFLLHFLKEGELFFDIGANVGSYTILASGVRKATTVSFEPIPSTYMALKENVKLNNLESFVVLKNMGLGSEKAVMKFTSQHDTVNHVIAKDEISTETIEIQVDTVDNLAFIHGCPSLIKIDVEGFETEVLNGMTNIFKNDNLKAIIIELNGSGQRYGFDESLIHKKMLDSGFAPYAYFPFTRDLRLLDIYGNTNTIYIRDVIFVKEKLQNAIPFEVYNELI
jgi:FkbM family methyltransferase